MFSFVLESCNVDEFCSINDFRNCSEVQQIIKIISKCKFKKENKCIYEGGDICKDLTHELLEQRCQDLLRTFFSRNGQFSGIITFLETDITAQGKPWKNVVTTLKKWCENSYSPNDIDNKNGASGMIIRNYDLEDHFKFCEATDYEALRKHSEGKFQVNKNDQSFLVLNPSQKIILVIRLVDAQQCGQLKHETHLCIDEVNIVSLLLRDELKDSGVKVAGLVTYLGENAHNDCSHCSNFIVSRKIFNSFEEFNRFVEENIFVGIAEPLKTRASVDATKIFQVFGIKILGYLAHLQFKVETLDKAVLPITKGSPSSGIREAELLLNRYQMETAYFNEKRILLHCNYGTGKTVVAIKKLELLYKRLKEKEVIYYVVFAAESRLDCMIKQKFKTYEKVRVLRGSSSLSHMVIKKILPKKDKNDTKK